MDQEKLSIRPNRINRGKRNTLIQKGATILVLLSSILPFLNNILKNFWDTESILLLQIPGAKRIDLDSAIFFAAMPISYLLIAFGGMFGANKKSYYAVYLSCYFQLFLTVNYIFLQQNKAYYYTQISILLIFIVVAVIYFLIHKYYRNAEVMIQFLDKTVERYSTIINKKKQKNDEING